MSQLAAQTPQFPVGSLVRFRERDWIVQPSDDPLLLQLKPLQGHDHEACTVYLPMEAGSIEPASFPWPDPAAAGDFVGAALLRDAVRLTLRSGAGPFRSMGKISVRPRPYQLVPLIMALRLNPVRLLIADDVGVGKTIEAGLIAKEMLERGEAQRVAVLCPPYLCEQWQRELAEKFHIDAVVVRASTISRLERRLPPGSASVYAHYPHLIISIDMAKMDRHRHAFLSGCPDLVIVDEAHHAARPPEHSGRDQQLRYELVQRIAGKRDRHLLLLTATPHSGIRESFASLLGLLDPELETLISDRMTEAERKRVAPHFVQRRRGDVQHYLGGDTPFPERESEEVAYRLNAAYEELFEDVFEWTRETVAEPGLAQHRRRVRYWGALALLRSLMSSPQAAVEALSNREMRYAEDVGEHVDGEDLDPLRRREILDVITEESLLDTVPEGAILKAAQSLKAKDLRRLRDFRRRAERILRDRQDAKLDKLLEVVADFLKSGYNPIVYCRFIATAQYVAAQLKEKLGRADLAVAAVTGEMSDDERATRVAQLADSPKRVLVATDCLSEGIDLQRGFNAVIHYDLPWNPNRLEQREGRVDRYGQPSPSVKTVLLYGVNNEVDRAILEVLIRKARQIRRDIGVTVPVPMDENSLMDAVIQSLFERRRTGQQIELPIATEGMHREWDRAAEREHASRTRFAQHAIKPDEVARELEETDQVLGDSQAVQRFFVHAAQRYGVSLRVSRGQYAVKPQSLPPLPWLEQDAVREAVSITFDDPAPEGTVVLRRNHPWVNWLAEQVIGEAFLDQQEGRAARCGAIYTEAVSSRTVLVLLRLRYRLVQRARPDLYAEEVIVTGFQRVRGELKWFAANDPEALKLLETAAPSANISPQERHERVGQALDMLQQSSETLHEIAQARAQQTAEAHNRLRRLAGGGRVKAEPYPPDVLGVYVLLPGGRSG